MSDFICRRRMFGVAVLLLACVFTAAWVRHQRVIDLVMFPTYSHTFYLASDNQQIRCVLRERRPADGDCPSWRTWQYTSRLLGPSGDEWLVVPYWILAGSLTLLSAWLLVGGPVERNPGHRAAVP